MRRFFGVLMIGLIVVGFIVPVAWAGALIAGMLALGCAPAGKRLDGKSKTGGLFGGVWDGLVIEKTMMKCPFCKTPIMKTAAKCPCCREWVTALPDVESGT